MIKVKNNIRLFNKMMRKRWKKYARRKHIHGHYVFAGWNKYMWIEHDMDCEYVKEHIDQLKRNHHCDPTIFDNVINLAGKRVESRIEREDKYYLVGLQKTNEDLYYIVESEDKCRRMCWSCCGKLNVLEY